MSAYGNYSRAQPAYAAVGVPVPPAMDAHVAVPATSSSLAASGARILRSSLSANPTLHDDIARFDALSAVLRELGDARAAMARGAARLADTERRLAAVEQKLREDRNAQPYAEKRLHRNAHPRFLHYFVINRQAKVERLTRELETLRQTENELVEEEARYHAQEREDAKALRALQSDVATMESALQERDAIFSRVVQSRPATARLVDLAGQLTATQMQRQQEEFLAAGIAQSLGLVGNALNLFNRAFGMLQEASSMNMGAAGLNMMGAFEGDRGGFDDFAAMVRVCGWCRAR
jgi:hypothetical protein